MGNVTKEKSITVEQAPQKIPPQVETVEKAEPPKGIARRWRHPLDLMRQMFEWDPFETVAPRLFSRAESLFAPEFSVKETKEAFIFKADVPGIELKDLDVSLTKNRLKITGHREEEKKDEGETYYAYERNFGSFTRSFALPEGVDAEKINASLKDGVLTIAVPKLPEVQDQTKKVAIKPS